MQKENQIYCEDIPMPIWNDQPDSSLGSANLWKIPVQDFVAQNDRLLQLLSKDELERASKYRQQKEKDRFVIGRGMLRQILSFCMNCDPVDIEFKKGLNNKPHLDHPAPLEFNVSYSNNFVLIALSSEPIGVDIEHIHPEFDYSPLLELCFMEKEIQTITSSPSPRRSFFQFWTRKEALLKATSLGLDDYLTDFSCLDGFQTIPLNLPTSEDWQVKSFLMDDSYFVSFAQRDSRAIKFINARPTY